MVLYDPVTGNVMFEGLSGEIGIGFGSASDMLLAENGGHLIPDDIYDFGLAPTALAWLHRDSVSTAAGGGYYGTIDAGNLVVPGTPADDLHFLFAPGLGEELTTGPICTTDGRGGLDCLPVKPLIDFPGLKLPGLNGGNTGGGNTGGGNTGGGNTGGGNTGGGNTGGGNAGGGNTGGGNSGNDDPGVGANSPIAIYEFTTGNVVFRGVDGEIGLTIFAPDESIRRGEVDNLGIDVVSVDNTLPGSVTWASFAGFAPRDYDAGDIVEPFTDPRLLSFKVQVNFTEAVFAPIQTRFGGIPEPNAAILALTAIIAGSGWRRTRRHAGSLA